MIYNILERDTKINKLETNLNEINTDLTPTAYIAPTIKSERASDIAGGYVRIGNLVIVNISLAMAIGNNDANYVNPLMYLPRPVKGTVDLYCKNGSTLNSRCYIDGSNTSGNLYVNYVTAGDSISIMGSYIAR